MISFVIAAALLVAVVLGILLPPLWRQAGSGSGTEQSAANLAIFRDQVMELERERGEGLISETDFTQASSELQRRLLDEVQPSAAPAAPPAAGRKTALALLLALPLAAAAGYALLGTPQALDPLQREARLAPQRIEAMVAGLVAKLEKNPDDAEGWLMLARSYKVLERFPAAAEAYSHAARLVDQDPALLADYADVLSRANGGKLAGQPAALVERALAINPEEPQALLLAGAAAADRQQFTVAADYWARLLAKLEPGSEEARALETAVAKARELAVQSRSNVAPAGSKAAVGTGLLSGEVSLSGKLAGQAKPDDLLFVFARAESGPRMPLAAMRARVADLPLRFRFDDSMALPGGRKISEFAAVSVEARVARAGQAQSSSGDLYGTLTGVKPGSDKLRVVIDQVQP